MQPPEIIKPTPGLVKSKIRTIVTTPAGHRALVLPYDASFPTQSRGDDVFIQPLHHWELPWQLVSSSDLTVIALMTPLRPVTAPDRTKTADLRCDRLDLMNQQLLCQCADEGALRAPYSGTEW